MFSPSLKEGKQESPFPAVLVLILGRIVFKPMGHQDHKIIEVNFAIAVYVSGDKST